MEKRRLAELCSREGSAEYINEIVNKKSSVIDILHTFPSCHPQLAVLLEHLPGLMVSITQNF